jgi:hypothetical protein
MSNQQAGEWRGRHKVEQFRQTGCPQQELAGLRAYLRGLAGALRSYDTEAAPRCGCSAGLPASSGEAAASSGALSPLVAGASIGRPRREGVRGAGASGLPGAPAALTGEAGRPGLPDPGLPGPGLPLSFFLWMPSLAANLRVPALSLLMP